MKSAVHGERPSSEAAICPANQAFCTFCEAEVPLTFTQNTAIAPPSNQTAYPKLYNPSL
jgi:hypothetical protein